MFQKQHWIYQCTIQLPKIILVASCCHGKGPTTHSRHEIGMISVFHKLEAQITCCIFLWDKEINIGQRHTLSQFLWTLYTDHSMICMSGACTEPERNDQVPVRTIAKLLGSKLLVRLLSYIYSLIFCRDVYFLAQHEFIKTRHMIFVYSFIWFSHF